MNAHPLEKERFRGIEKSCIKIDFESCMRPKSSSLVIEDTFLMIIIFNK